MLALPNTWVLKPCSILSEVPLAPWSKASGSYSSLDRWVPQGDRLAPQVIHRPLAGAVSTLKYFTRVSAPVSGFWSSVSTAMGEDSRPYMLSPFKLREVYSNCTTANTVWPLTPGTLAPGTVSSEEPSGASEKNWRGVAPEVSMIGWWRMST